MKMEFMAEFTEDMSRDRARKIVKRKRTKRQRLCSPFSISTDDDHNDCLIDNPTPDDQSSEISTEEEDEDMANCLIMLAQSNVSPATERNSDQIRRKTATETATAGGIGNSGDCVYECKTCNRTFPSFQALGGHRASHKKPKVNVEEKKSSSVNIPPPLTEYSDEDHDPHKAVVEDEDNIHTGVVIISKGKVHECSICGSEFSSGQALGGHMRKHRPIPAVNRTELMITAVDSAADQMIGDSTGGGGSTVLLLDLNFPPPEVAEEVRSELQFTGGDSRRHLVISATALVDCHY